MINVPVFLLYHKRSSMLLTSEYVPAYLLYHKRSSVLLTS